MSVVRTLVAQDAPQCTTTHNAITQNSRKSMTNLIGLKRPVSPMSRQTDDEYRLAESDPMQTHIIVRTVPSLSSRSTDLEYDDNCVFKYELSENGCSAAIKDIAAQIIIAVRVIPRSSRQWSPCRRLGRWLRS